MLKNWTPERVMALALDPSVAKDAKKLAAPPKWETLGRSDQSDKYIWGEIKGSSAKPYQVKIDLTEPAFSCTCPSRKLPCKHSLALLLVAVEHPEQLMQTALPDWMSEWLNKRATRTKKRAQNQAEESRPVDAAAQAKRAQQRTAKVAAGLAELDLWLRDLVRNGLANVQAQSYAFWDQAAARMIDAQSPGLANRLRDLAGIPASGQGWPERLLEQIGLLHLLIEAFGRIDQLSTDTQSDIRMLIGWPVGQEDVLAQSGIHGRWLTVGQSTEKNDNLIARRTWLHCLMPDAQKPFALLLEFAHPSQASVATLVPGALMDAELCFYPGTTQYRALIKMHTAAEPNAALPKGVSIREFIGGYAAALSCNPWLEELPAILGSVIPYRRGDDWLMRDVAGDVLPLEPHFARHWELLALSGGQSITVFGEWNGRFFLPFSAWADHRFVTLTE